jgi:hypothetical protein
MICSSRRDSNRKCQNLSEIPTASAAGAQKPYLLFYEFQSLSFCGIVITVHIFFLALCVKKIDN